MTTPFPFVSGSVLPAQSLNDITNLPINDQTASYTLVVGDAGKRVVMNVASGNTVTVNDSVFTTGDTIFIANKGAGASTLTAGAGVTLNGTSLEVPQFQSASIVFLTASSALVFTGGKALKTEVQQFTVGGTFTVPAGVTYAVAHIRAGGGGIGATSGAGGTSSVAFAGGTISATGGAAQTAAAATNGAARLAGAANSGNGATATGGDIGGGVGFATLAQNGAEIVAGAAVTPAASITVTVGAGGTLGTNGAAGGSGYVWIEYQV